MGITEQAYWTDWPVAGVGAIVLALLLAISELGYRWGRHGDGDTSAPAHILSATLGLLALLLGFTFSLALSRYEARRELVVAEADAIGTAMLRAELLESPYRDAVAAALRDYARVRVEFGQPDPPPGFAERMADRQDRLWRTVGVAVNARPGAQLSGAMLSAVNEAFDRAADRSVERSARVPPTVLDALLITAMIAAFLLGQAVSHGPGRHRVGRGLLLATLAMTFMLILDLDRPRSGTILVDQTAMIDVLGTKP